ncbi:GFA family protein [Pseudooceanicola sp. CBS1P-1]|uniref:GFA family protein n=1 Tax=Pseudooceanicola albus TaxID=2692189 RepID=A0A6L7G431_9RHOB|nr:MULTISPECIES: GFA family protein [Pseudooceanicola]MBT9384741.1 GFA family protein [Pseudooceanicola endophyticus]MXN18442.1 GFA family protein [Pseudooceanicola albus]
MQPLFAPDHRQEDHRQGRCLCGAVRYDWTGPVNWVGHCHCESCRRATAAPFTTFVSTPDRQLHWHGTAPAIFASSPGVERLFCPRCGTPLAYRTAELPDETHTYLANLLDAAGLPPDRHFFWNERVDWITLADDGLPRE